MAKWVELLKRNKLNQYQPTRMGQLLGSNHPQSMRNIVLHLNENFYLNGILSNSCSKFTEN
jgi:hypothetical protein